MADVIEPCSNTSRLEVITDVTMIRSSMAPRCGAELYTHHVKCNQRVVQKRKRQEGCVRSARTQMGRFPPRARDRARPVWGRSLNETLTFMLFSRLRVFLWLSPPPCMWVTLREKTFNHCSTSNSPLPSGTPACNKWEGRKKKKKSKTAHRAGQWKSFPLDFFRWWAKPRYSRNPITSTKQCLQQGINPTVHSPLFEPRGGRREWLEWSGETCTKPRLPLPRHFTAPGDVCGQMSLSFQSSHLEMTEWDGMIVKLKILAGAESFFIVSNEWINDKLGKFRGKYWIQNKKKKSTYQHVCAVKSWPQLILKYHTGNLFFLLAASGSR